ncbi:MAG: hypothetical protein IAE80_11505 [Anaerolinea sp.]|nr:hypothetical protein [Anaerolinea sp.]
MSRNTACFGSSRIDYTRFTEAYPDDYFTSPGDRADLTTTQTIQTGAFDLANESWGVDVMNVQANLPNALEGNGVVYIQLGGVEIENDVQPENAVILPETGTSITALSAVQMLTDPPQRPAAEFITTVPAGSVLSADAVDELGDSVRVIYQNRPGWVSRTALDQTVDLSALPAIGPESFTPMQSFYFRVGIGGVSCTDAPSLLFVQGPAGIPVDIRVHKQNIRIESSVIFRTLPPGDQLGDAFELVTLSGLVRINPGTPQEVIVPPGYASQVPFCPEFESLGIEGDTDEKADCGDWSPPRPLSGAELDALDITELIPLELLNYRVETPEVVTASGRTTLPDIVFVDRTALLEARDACLAGELPEETCAYLNLEYSEPETVLSCPVVVQNVLTNIGDYCRDMGRNSTCFASQRLDYARFTQTFPADYYAEPGDIGALVSTATIRTGGLNLNTSEWGANIMHLQGNLPNSIGGNGINLVQFGDVEVENGVQPGSAVVLLDQGIAISSTAPADLLSDPPQRAASELLGSVPAGAELSADAIDEIGTYVRVVFEGIPGWIPLDALDKSVDLSSLPVIGENSFTPMQSFYFRTGSSGDPCDTAPSMLFVQGPRDISVDLRVFDQPMRIDSTAVMRTLPAGSSLGSSLQVAALYGMVRILPGTDQEVVIPPGYTSEMPFCTEFTSLGIEGDADEKLSCGQWSEPRPLSASELDGMRYVDNLPLTAQNYDVIVPTITTLPDSTQQLVFPDPAALDLARAACSADALPAEVCTYLGL